MRISGASASPGEAGDVTVAENCSDLYGKEFDPPRPVPARCVQMMCEAKSPNLCKKKCCFCHVLFVYPKSKINKNGKSYFASELPGFEIRVLRRDQKMHILSPVFRFLTVGAFFNVFTKFERSWH